MRLSLPALLLFAAAAPAQSPQRADLKAGLVFTMTEAQRFGPTTRLEPTVALNLAAGESPHPSLKQGETFRWSGYVSIFLPGTHQFSAHLAGRLSVRVGDKPVLFAESKGDYVTGQPVDLSAGVHAFEAELVRTRPAVRAELLWDGPNFVAEPVPYFFFGHLPAQRPQTYASDLQREHGRFLFEELACAKCHVPGPNDGNPKFAEHAGPTLSDVGSRARPGWVDAWLADPSKLRPHTAMPKMFADTDDGRAERYAVTRYLASLGGPPKPAKIVAPNDHAKLVDAGQRLYLTAGCAACHGDKVNAPPSKRQLKEDEDEKPALLPEDSVHALGTAAPTGYYRLGAVGSKYTVPSLAKYLENPLASHPGGRMPNMTLTSKQAEELARFLCQITDGGPKPDLEPEPRAKPPEGWEAAGKKLVVSKGCVSCHVLPVRDKPPTVDGGLVRLARTPDGGCLSDAPDAAKVPVYTLTRDQRDALRTFARAAYADRNPNAPAYEARRALKRFNCLNCHNHDGEGGVDEALSEQMKALENAQNADDVQPPRLTGVGRKARAAWLTDVLRKGGRARPWMSLKMPQFGDANVAHLCEGLPKLDGALPDDAPEKPSISAKKVEAGRLLSGKQGLGCIACHDISGVQGGGTRGPDLATVTARVRREWFGRWMHQPQRMAPGTRMPQNYINGKSQFTAVADGDGDAQIEAFWSYFSLGPGLPLPSGIEPPGKALAVAVRDRPEILRTFLPDAGTKSFAVGYPGGVNVAFDSGAGRLAYAWSGNFLDASPVWNDRGGRPANLLGPKFLTPPAGHPWAVGGADTAPPDFAARADDPAFGRQLPNDAFYGGPRRVQFQGVSVGSDGVPTFAYALTEADGRPLAVREAFAPLPAGVGSGLSRKWTLDRTADSTVFFLAGVSDRPARPVGALAATAGQAAWGDYTRVPAVGTRVVVPTANGRATVSDLRTGPPGAEWLLYEKGGKHYAVLRLPAGEWKGFALELHQWGLARDDAALVEGLPK